MGLFGFATNLVSATIKTVVSPIAIIDDMANIMGGEPVDSTTNVIRSVSSDLQDAIEEITP
jgi:hypothetical protein